MRKTKSLMVEILLMVQRRKLYWIAPILFALALLTLLMFLGIAAGGAAPFIYTLF